MLSTEEAIGYMIMSAKQMNLEKSLINELKAKMRENIDTIVEQVAEKYYYDN